MQHVLEGFVSFKETVFPKHRKLFAKLSSAQSPEVLLITCSDSRIDPNMVTQTSPGDLFIIRNAGNIVPTPTSTPGGVTATIEYAVAVLGVGHIVVCGHTHCGAMSAACDPSSLDDLPHVRAWLDHARGAVEIVKRKRGCAGPAQLREVTEQNVLQQLQHLRTHPVVAARIATSQIQLHAWVYEIESGEVYCHDERTGEFRPLAERYEALLQRGTQPQATAV